MGDGLIKQFGADINLIAGSGGIFEVEFDGKKIFSKKNAGRFPELSEIISTIEE